MTKAKNPRTAIKDETPMDPVKEVVQETSVLDIPAEADTQHQDVINLIRGKTLEMSYTVHGLPKSRRISGKMADTVASSVGGTKRGVRSSWSMFTSEHPAVKELNAALRDLDVLRDTWTIVKSADVRATDDKVTIEGGKRLIWDADVAEFHALFTYKAIQIDRAAEKLQYAMDNSTIDSDGEKVPSVKEMDKENAGAAWDESVYPKDLTLKVGVAKERDKDGKPLLDGKGLPMYLIKFEEYHVSEKLPEALRERALRRIEDGLSSTIETSMSYAANELTDNMLTFLGELTNRIKMYPASSGAYAHLEGAELIKLVTHDKDDRVPQGHVKCLLRYKQTDEGGNEETISRWYGPMPESVYIEQLKPQQTPDKKKIYPTVIESIVEQLEAFKAKKAKMLGGYGTSMAEAFEPLLEKLTKAKRSNVHLTNADSAQKLASALRSSNELKTSIAEEIRSTVAKLEQEVITVQKVARRRSIRKCLVD